MWASGSNMNVRKEIFDHEKFDPQLLRYSYGEDLDFSFRVYKRFGSNAILFQPKAKLIHNVAPAFKLPKYDSILMRMVNKIYFNYKNVGRKASFNNDFQWLWYNFGLLLFNSSKIFKGDYKSLFYFFAAQYQVWLHRQDIKNLDIEWMNIKLFNEKSTPTAKIIEKREICLG